MALVTCTGQAQRHLLLDGIPNRKPAQEQRNKDAFCMKKKIETYNRYKTHYKSIPVRIVC